MFTGIVTDIGTLREIRPGGDEKPARIGSRPDHAFGHENERSLRRRGASDDDGKHTQ